MIEERRSTKRAADHRRLDWPTVLFWACWPILAVLVAVAVAALL